MGSAFKLTLYLIIKHHWSHTSPQQCFSTLREAAVNRNLLFFCSQGRSYTWLGEEEALYSNWKDGEPNQIGGCGHMSTTGQWITTPCDAKLEAAICQISGVCNVTAINIHQQITRMMPNLSFPRNKEAWINFKFKSLFFFLPDEPVSHQWVYPGQCPHSLGAWAWVPFRNHCYAFNLQSLKLQQDARMSCKKGRETPHIATVLTPAVLLMLYHSWYWIGEQLAWPSPPQTQSTKCIDMSKFRSVIHWAGCTDVKSPYMIDSLFSVVSSLCISLLLSPPVGAELLSILDETENGFISEHIQSYAEQAHGAWLGISVKGRAMLPEIASSSSTAVDMLTFTLYKSYLKTSLLIRGYF